ncbi:phospholipase/carboxylesterase [Novimethylophilus kurashikiensis]|uniref:Phospholipase/carboxylesterase n=1 Tax=Novimethylophilus kurashikiensis TaxID=1825523 RepID=A0A2R5FE11_9PROT|nr:dienelactone hydrolase family protein [Novimethylophilus kurashikiensis]GBG15678.1 phospholipase/carboxylesterase [Novimethylophilus kurashikiensis]
MLETIEICEVRQADASIIWLHGLGASGDDFVPVVEELALPCAVRFVFPHAPRMPVTVNGGYIMPAWYDITSLDIAGVQDESGIRQSQASVEMLIEQEMARGVPSERILLAGFSQGGAVVLQTALRCPQRLGGVMALSTYLPLYASLPMEKTPINAGIPVFMAHGRFDTVIPIEAAEASRSALESEGFAVEWHEYPMAHTVSTEEIADIRRYLMQVLG